MGTKEIKVVVTEEEHSEWTDEKDGRTWYEVMEDGVYGPQKTEA